MGKNKFKVGDVVKTCYGKGVIKEIKIGSTPYLVYHYDWKDGHNGNSHQKGSYKGNHCYWFYECDLELINTDQITITRYDNKVVAKYGDKVGIARCNPEDEFNFETGAKLAFERLFEKPLGYVKVINIGGTYSTYGSFFKENNCEEFKERYKMHHSPKNGEIYKVLFRGKHAFKYHTFILVIEGDDGQVYLIGDEKEYVEHLDEKPVAAKEPFKPYLTHAGKHCGYIGEETNMTLLFGERLYVGDVVEVYASDTKHHYGESLVCKQDDTYFVMGLMSCNFENSTCNEFQIKKVKSHKYLNHDESYRNVKVILKEEK